VKAYGMLSRWLSLCLYEMRFLNAFFYGYLFKGHSIDGQMMCVSFLGHMLGEWCGNKGLTYII
jgi:hypothetical protein